MCRRQNGLHSFDGFFDKEYYSHILGQRKPNSEPFLTILKEQDIKADETIFIDDSLQHVIGAKSVGIHAIHLVAIHCELS